MKVKLHIVRHGETAWHHENRYAGSTDIALTEKGQTQALNLVPWVHTAHLQTVMSSDLKRAADSAKPLAKAAGVELVTDHRLREVDFGLGEGLTTKEMWDQFPEQRAAFESRPATSPLPGGESGLDAIERALPAVFDALAAADGGNTIFVIHSTLGRLLLCEFLGIETDKYRRVFPQFINSAVTTLGFTPPRNIDDLRNTGALLELNFFPPRRP